MKKETLEEAAKRYTNTWFKSYDYAEELFIEGAKWQQEQDKEMLKEQIKQAYNDGKGAVTVNYKNNMSLEKYYNETFKNETK